ncbi:phox domain-containing protein [Citrus sinensis]|nr:phox domain-containing protein [Citrus sinensis]
MLSNEVEISWKVKARHPQTYLSLLEKKQLSVNDSRLSNASAPQKWKRKIDSPIVESAISEFIDKILKDFVDDLWYSDITPDREAPELMRSIIMDAIGEISGRVKTINLVDLLTRDVVDLIGDHLDLFRRNQAVIGVDVMRTLSSEERDERLKYHLTASKELHPALISPESEYKVLQRIMSGVLTVVLRPREAHCPIVRTIARELVTCLVIQPVMNLASPSYINELIEVILLAIRDDSNRGLSVDKRTGEMKMGDSISGQFSSLHNQGTDMIPTNFGNQREMSLDDNTSQEESVHLRAAEWAQMLEAVTQRRTEVLTPENLENMWTKGRNYKKKEQKRAEKAGVREYLGKGQGVHSAVPTTNMGGQGIHSAVPTTNMGKDVLTNRIGLSAGTGEKALLGLPPGLSLVTQISEGSKKETQLFQNFDGDLLNNTDSVGADANRSRIKKSSSTSALKTEPDSKKAFTGESGGSIIAEFYSPDFGRSGEELGHKNASDVMLCSDGQHCPKLKCRVMGAYFEKLGSKSFAVYSIAVTDSEKRTCFVKRRYRNFERLHRHLKEFPNYTLHLPPKRIFSSSTEDAFVHQRLNVDDAVDDIVRQFKGVSDGLMRKVVGSPSPTDDASSISGRNLSLSTDEISKCVVRQNTSETVNSFSDNEDGDKDGSYDLQEVTSFAQGTGWHSDNELNSKGFPPRVVKRGEESRNLATQKEFSLEAKTEGIGQVGFPAASSPLIPDHLEDPAGMPPEWTPSNVSVPLLNLVDKVFQLKRRGWLRRQVFWMSKQILQLVMEDAIDDWLLRQIYCLRREDNIALGIRWLQDVLWPGGTFFTRVGNIQTKDDAQPDLKSFQAVSQLGGSKVLKPGSFEEQLEAARRASDVKKVLFDGAPTALVSLIGSKQYKRCARDIYYFTQSTVCVKQLAYAILELLILSVFPELRDLLLSLREKMPAPPA